MFKVGDHVKMTKFLLRGQLIPLGESEWETGIIVNSYEQGDMEMYEIQLDSNHNNIVQNIPFIYEFAYECELEIV
jgi:hypothetical protein